MFFIFVNLYYNNPGECFDPDRVLGTFLGEFADVQVLPDDPLIVRAENAKLVLSEEIESQRIVLAQMRRDTEQQGPARAFLFTVDGMQIRGLVKRHLLQLTFDSPLTEAASHCLISVIRRSHSLGDKMVVEQL